MKALLLFLLLGILSFTKDDGSASAILEGVSDSGRTVFKASIQDIDGGIDNATFTIDGESIKFNYNARSCAISDLDNGVYTLHIESTQGDYQYIQLWGLPNSFKANINERHKIDYSFKAKIRGTDPRPDEYSSSPTIILNCRLTWEI